MSQYQAKIYVMGDGRAKLHWWNGWRWEVFIYLTLGQAQRSHPSAEVFQREPHNIRWKR